MNHLKSWIQNELHLLTMCYIFQARYTYLSFYEAKVFKNIHLYEHFKIQFTLTLNETNAIFQQTMRKILSNKIHCYILTHTNAQRQF